MAGFAAGFLAPFLQLATAKASRLTRLLAANLVEFLPQPLAGILQLGNACLEPSDFLIALAATGTQ
jgi:hypothetical protein